VVERRDDDGSRDVARPEVSGRPPLLSHDELVRAQAETLDTPRREYGVLARVLFTTLDTLYGKKRTLSKFKVLELVARVPYQTWEQVAYIAITHMHGRRGWPGGSTTASGSRGSSRTTSSGTC